MDDRQEKADGNDPLAAALEHVPGRRGPILVALLLFTCWIFELGGRYMHTMGYISSLNREMTGVVAFTVLLASAVFVFSRIRSGRAVKVLMLAGITFLLFFQISDFVDEFDWTSSYPMLAKGHTYHLLLEDTLVITGLLLLLWGFFLALLSGNYLLRRYRRDKENLRREVHEREVAERALVEAQANLEEQVRLRTLELAESNEALRAELVERSKFEEHLAMRLRYEEGLANCSHILLADSDPPEALKRALHQLLVASDASRVYFFENIPTTDRGLCCRMTHEAWDPERNPDCKPGMEMDLSYDDGLDSWRKALAKGEVVTEDVETALPEVRRTMAHFGSSSLLLLPVGWEGRWRGFLGFDETARPRHWSDEEVRMLRTAAEMFGACKDRQVAEAALRKAHHELEQRVSDRTSDLSRANQELNREMEERQKTEREKLSLEVQLRQAQKMQAIGTLAGGIAHDFNNILASILGYSELALRKMGSENPFARYFEEVLRSGNRAKELVRQILLFSRQAEQERAPVHLHLIAQEVSTLMQASCPANITITKHLDSDAGAVLGDAVQMHQVLLHLCSNAQHAMRKTGGELSISITHEYLDAIRYTPYGEIQPGDYVVASVSDTGHGITPGTLERIFEPFFTTKTVAEGTGMGLAIAHGIITGMGGVITVDSAMGEGTTFTLYLPQMAEETTKPEPISDRLAGTEHILVIDDEAQLVALWSELLGQYGYKISGYANSLEGLEAFRQAPEQFDLVLLDQTMPAMNGAEVAKAMLDLRPSTPIIMATGFSEAIDAERAREIGLRDLVYKPILGHDLASAIRKALESASDAVLR